MDEEIAHDMISHKRQKVQNYPLQVKITAIEYVKIDGNRTAEVNFGVDRKIRKEWRANKEEIKSTAEKVKGAQRRRVSGDGRKPFK